MSVNPPKHELNQLIYRHLKEHGFHSAAEELQKQSPQDVTNLSASLLDIYSSWLNDSKREKQSDPTKHSTFKEKRKSSIKASKKQTPTTPIQTRAEEDCGSHSEELSQSLLPQTPTASSKLYPPKTPIKPVTRSPDKPVRPGPLVQAAPGDSSDTTDISEEEIRLPVTPVPQSKSNNDAPDQNKTGTAKKQMAIKDQTPKKQAVTVTTPPIGKAKKKVDKPAKKEQDPKKSVPVKRKKTGENTAVTKKSKTSGKDALAERDASDSDSSLDVEKWKKLLLNMTETDVAKMDAINALDSSTPQPKKKRENKPRTKPSAKTEIQPPQNDRTSNDMDTVLVGDVTQTPAKTVKAKKNRAEKTASLNSPNAMNPNTDTVAIRPLSSIPSPSKETVEEENVIVAAYSEIKIDQKSKKKKIKKTEDAEGENFSNTFVDSIDNKEEKKKSEDKETCNSHVKNKNAKADFDDGKEPIRNVELKTESIVQQKKLKKKKKKNDEETLEQKTEGEIDSEKMAEEENIGQSKKAKKKKQKDKIDVDSAENTSREKDVQTEAAETEDNVGENNSEPISNKKKRKKKRKHHEENLEAVLEKNKFEEQEDQENVANPSECTDEGEQPAEVNHKNKKSSSVKNDSVAFSPLLPSHEELGPPSEKKKKKKSTEVQESPVVPVQDASASLQTPLSSKNKKKKKKASRSILGENL
ncbi:muscle M-line assembly protein unc-89-like isoform X1 [Takifugu flavidus]|uniref:muscle M-line assembly protein unc-89-like isoform X1 n=1 Tax=Takifugu flavidus TaxID=433684 RepID=UPI00254485D9|nr:muscle M-line assembly protein unc-89-like isoform X1 [Takifugu flavidus]